MLSSYEVPEGSADELRNWINLLPYSLGNAHGFELSLHLVSRMTGEKYKSSLYSGLVKAGFLEIKFFTYRVSLHHHSALPYTLPVHLRYEDGAYTVERVGGHPCCKLTSDKFLNNTSRTDDLNLDPNCCR